MNDRSVTRLAAHDEWACAQGSYDQEIKDMLVTPTPDELRTEL
jgi:hypothetical protein